MKSLIRAVAVFAFLAFLAFASHAFAQAGFDDDRVMLQGFYWESYRHGHDDPRFGRFGNKRWYEIVKDLAKQMRDARFDLSTAEIRGLAGFVKRLAPSTGVRSAFVASGNLEYGLLRIFKAFRETKGNLTAVFRDKQRAVAWLVNDSAVHDDATA